MPPAKLHFLRLSPSPCSYFPIRIIKTVELPPDKGPYMCLLHPHGIFCFAGFIGFVTNGAGYDDLYPGSVFHGLTLDLSFKTPFVREFHLLHGNCEHSPPPPPLQLLLLLV